MQIRDLRTNGQRAGRVARRLVGLEAGNDKVENDKARNAYATLLRHDPSRAVSPGDLARIEDYARTVLGSRHYAPWLRFYTAWHGRFREGWISENYIDRYYPARVSAPFRAYGSRTMSARMLRTDRLPDLAYRIRGQYYTPDYVPIPPDRVVETVFAEHPRVVLKRDLTFQGRAVLFTDRDGFEARARETPGDFAVQRPLVQHPFFTDLSPAAAATLRVCTLRRPGEPARACAAYLRLGRTTSDVVRADLQVRVPVDLVTRATAEGHLPGWTPVEVHPDTGAPLSGLEVPDFPRAVELGEALHARIPQLPYIGWDFCLTRDEGPMLFEVNALRPGANLVQAHFGPVFAGTGLDRLHSRQRLSQPSTLR